MSVIFLGKSYSSQTYLSLIPVIVGVGIATAGDYYFTTMGFILTLVGTLLAGIKTILTNQIQKNTSTPLHPLDLLLRMSPLACLQSFIYAAILDEPRRSYTLLGSISPLARNTLIVKLTINGALAFGLNYVSFAANKKTSPLTMTVAANIKQCLSIILGVWVFRLRVGWMNALGIIIALMGGAWYARIELGSKKRRRAVDTLGIKVNEKEVVWIPRANWLCGQRVSRRWKSREEVKGVEGSLLCHETDRATQWAHASLLKPRWGHNDQRYQKRANDPFTITPYNPSYFFPNTLPEPNSRQYKPQSLWYFILRPSDHRADWATETETLNPIPLLFWFNGCGQAYWSPQAASGAPFFHVSTKSLRHNATISLCVSSWTLLFSFLL